MSRQKFQKHAQTRKKMYVHHTKKMWTSVSECTVREFGEKASVLRLLHQRQAQMLQILDRWLVAPSLIASMASAAVSSTIPVDEDNTWPRYLAAGFALTAGILTGISKHMHFSERAESHRRTSMSYAKIYRVVATELALSRSHRTTAAELLRKVRMQLDSVGEDALILDRSIVHRFMLNFENKENICIPEVCNGLKRIAIRIDDDSIDDVHDIDDSTGNDEIA